MAVALTPNEASIFTQPSPLSSLLSPVRTFVVGFRAYLGSAGWTYLKVLYYVFNDPFNQISSHSQVLGGCIFLGGVLILPTTTGLQAQTSMWAPDGVNLSFLEKKWMSVHMSVGIHADLRTDSPAVGCSRSMVVAGGCSFPSLYSPHCRNGQAEAEPWERVAHPAFTPNGGFWFSTPCMAKWKQKLPVSLFPKGSNSCFIYSVKNKLLLAFYLYSCLF